MSCFPVEAGGAGDPNAWAIGQMVGRTCGPSARAEQTVRSTVLGDGCAGELMYYELGGARVFYKQHICSIARMSVNRMGDTFNV